MLYFLCRRRYAEAELAQIWLDEVIETFGLSEEEGPRRLKLAEVVRFVMKLSREKPCVMILDECQELDYVAPAFWADLQVVWDREKDNSRLLLMMSVSIAAAIRHIFDDASEPLFGRQDLALTLTFTAEAFWPEASQGNLSRSPASGNAGRSTRLLRRYGRRCTLCRLSG